MEAESHATLGPGVHATSYGACTAPPSMARDSRAVRGEKRESVGFIRGWYLPEPVPEAAAPESRRPCVSVQRGSRG